MEMISENVTFKVDACGRVVIPASLRKKFDMLPGDKVSCYTTQVDGEWFVAFKKAKGNDND